MSEYIDFVTNYATDVVNGKKEFACKTEVQACKRHLDDLKRADNGEDGLEWRPDVAFKVISFAEKLKVYNKNQKKYEPLKLRGFQKFIIGSLFGWYQNDIRRFSQCYVSMARKNGKSFINSFLCLAYATITAIRDGQIYCAGTNFDNASIVWKDCVKLIEADKNLSEFFTIKDYSDSRSKIINKKNNTIIRPLSGDTKKDGFLPYLGCVDEYHLHETDEMFNVLLDGQVGLNGSLLAVITTAGKNLIKNPCYKQYKYCKQILSGAMKSDDIFIYIAEIDLPDAHKEPEKYNEALWNRENWCMANPYLLYDDDYHVTKDVNKWKDFISVAEKAKHEEGTTLNNFIIKKLNCWTTVGSDAYINMDDWAACGTEPVDIHGKKCYIGLDLSSKNDLTSFSAIFPIQQGINIPYIYSHSFLPSGMLERHILRDKLPYDRWALKGYLSLTDCNGVNKFILDYRFIANYLKEFIKDNDLHVILLGYDAAQIGGIMQDLDDIPCEKVEIGQYPKSMNEATRHFQGTVAGRQLCYDKGNELLSVSVGNAVAVINSKHEMLIDKQMQRDRIDPIDAVLDGWKCMLLTDNTEDKKEKDKKVIDEWLHIMEKL